MKKIDFFKYEFQNLRKAIISNCLHQEHLMGGQCTCKIFCHFNFCYFSQNMQNSILHISRLSSAASLQPNSCVEDLVPRSHRSPYLFKASDETLDSTAVRFSNSSRKIPYFRQVLPGSGVCTLKCRSVQCLRCMVIIRIYNHHEIMQCS